MGKMLTMRQRYVRNAQICLRWAKRIYYAHGDCPQVWMQLFFAEEYFDLARREL